MWIEALFDHHSLSSLLHISWTEKFLAASWAKKHFPTAESILEALRKSKHAYTAGRTLTVGFHTLSLGKRKIRLTHSTFSMFKNVKAIMNT